MAKYKLMPVEATPEQERAAENYWNDRRFKGLTEDPRTWAGVYRAMVDAAPVVEQEPVADDWIKFPAKAWAFLKGETDLDGHWFGDAPDGWPAFWWRSGIQGMVDSAPPPAPDVSELVNVLEQCIGWFDYYIGPHELRDVMKSAVSAHRKAQGGGS